MPHRLCDRICGRVVAAQVLTLSRDQFTALLGSLDHLRTVWRVEALRRVPLLRELSSKQLHHLAGVLAQVRLRRTVCCAVSLAGLIAHHPSTCTIDVSHVSGPSSITHGVR